MHSTGWRDRARGTWIAIACLLLAARAIAQEATPVPDRSIESLPATILVGEPAEVAEGNSSIQLPKATADANGPKKKTPKPFKDPFYRNDFSYLDDPAYVSQDPFDRLKRIGLTPHGILDVGGEVRLRLQDEGNLRLDGKSNDFLLQRTRLYGDLRHDDWLRGYGELIDSTISFERRPPRTSEEDRADVLNLFLDVRLGEDGRGGSLWARVGRQELDLGSQRLCGAADWANDRNTFDGVKAFWKSKSWDAEAFWTKPVPFARTVEDIYNFRAADPTEQFMGTFATWHEVKEHTVDLYYLRLERDKPVSRGDPPLVPFDANTFGGRWLGRRDHWLWEVEAAYQFGQFNRDDQSAGFFVGGLGYDFKSLPWQPILWIYYDWASGNDVPGGRRNGTFNQLFPHAHVYLGVTDILGRQNLEDLNVLLLAKPHERVALTVEGHIFHLESARDSLYNVGGAPIRTDPTGRSGTDIGQEFDVSARIQLTFHTTLLLSYGHFFAGSYLANTGIGKNADAMYTQLAFKF